MERNIRSTPIEVSGSLDDVGHIALVGLGIEVLNLLAGVFLVLRQVEVRT